MTGMRLAAFFVAFATLGPVGVVHRYHVTTARMAVEGDAAVCEIQFFRHDLEEAISRHSGISGYRLSADATGDSLFLAYLDSHLEVAVNGVEVSPVVSGSGEEIVRDHEMWWYRIQFQSGTHIESVSVTNRLLFELFDDQRNVLQIQHFPSEKRETFYFVADSDHHDIRFSS